MSGDVMHLAATHMLATSINHGINLEHQVSLQYLYYLDQIGVSISPLSNNFLLKKINEYPFPKLFKRGLNVTLSTDDPLLFHMSDDALLEEYSVARASFDLSIQSPQREGGKQTYSKLLQFRFFIQKIIVV